MYQRSDQGWMDLQRADTVSSHISALMQDCWSQCRNEHSYVCVWYQSSGDDLYGNHYQYHHFSKAHKIHFVCY
jgi:hypothetical protein